MRWTLAPAGRQTIMFLVAVVARLVMMMRVLRMAGLLREGLIFIE